MQVDISDPAQAEKVFKATVERYGRVDIFASNAAIMRGGHLVSTDSSNLQEHLDVNDKGSFHCCQLAAKQMIKQGKCGRIIVISSIDGMEGNEGEIPYAMSKAALILMIKGMAVELSPHKINVNAIAWLGATEMSVPYIDAPLMK